MDHSAAAPNTISEILRSRDLAIKKVKKDSTGFVAFSTVTGDSKLSNDVSNAHTFFQSVFDRLSLICEKTATLRRANLSTFTDATDYFSGKPMTISECRQHIIGDKLVGAPSVVFILRQIYNAILLQAKNVKVAVSQHNATMKNDLKRILDVEYNAHVRERESYKAMTGSTNDFESAYEAKIKNMESAFWAKYEATSIDPLDIFNVLETMSNWLNNFERQREMKINHANNGPIGKFPESSSFVGEPSVSLEELMMLTKEQHNKITTATSRLVVVSWKIGDKEPKSSTISTASVDYDNLLKMVKVYGEMQFALLHPTTFIELNVSNPLTGVKMSGIDVVDFQHVVIPTLSNMIKLAEKQKTVCTKQVKDQEQSVKSEVMKLLEGSMSTASSRPTPEKMKEYTSSLFDSVSLRLISDSDLEPWIKRFQTIIDTFDSDIKTTLSTANANIRVPVTWEDVSLRTQRATWETIESVVPLTQFEVGTAATYNWDAAGALGGWDVEPVPGSGGRF